MDSIQAQYCNCLAGREQRSWQMIQEPTAEERKEQSVYESYRRW